MEEIVHVKVSYMSKSVIHICVCISICTYMILYNHAYDFKLFSFMLTEVTVCMSALLRDYLFFLLLVSIFRCKP